MVIYYELPKGNDSTEITLDILDATGKKVRSFSSEKDKTYKTHNGGGPALAPVLSKKEGLNRFVWDMKTPSLVGVSGVYIESGFRGHKVPPGTYTLNLKVGNQTISEKGKITAIPTYSTTPAQYAEYHVFMTAMEGTLNNMHKTLNSVYKVQHDLKEALKNVTDASLKKEGQQLLEQLDAWDKDMVQRKSQAYDDVENFPNKFTAEYLFLIDATNSTIPRVNQASKDRKTELDAQWKVLESRANVFINTSAACI